jgi:hypothetical protein
MSEITLVTHHQKTEENEQKSTQKIFILFIIINLCVYINAKDEYFIEIAQ